MIPNRHHRNAIWVIGVAMLASATAGAAQIPSVGDDVPVLRYGAAAQPEGSWAVGRPLVLIGSEPASGPQIFHHIAGVIPLGESTLVVGDAGSSELRFFAAPSGRHVRTVGGLGKGPGEINELWDVWRTADAIVAVDAFGRASWFDVDGGYRRSTPPPIDVLGFRLERAGFFADGTALAYAVERDSDAQPNGRTTIGMRIVTLDGDEPTLVLRYPHHIVTRRAVAQSWGLVFGPTAALIAIGDRFCVGFPQEYAIDCLARDGQALYRIVRDASPRTAVTRRDRDDYFTVNEAANPGPRGPFPIVSRRRGPGGGCGH